MWPQVQIIVNLLIRSNLMEHVTSRQDITNFHKIKKINNYTAFNNTSFPKNVGN